MAESSKDFIKEIIKARVLGTGVHLTNPKKGVICVSYRNIRIWGIKTILLDFISDLLYTITKSISITESDFDIIGLEKTLHDISSDYEIEEEILKKNIKDVKIPKNIWRTMDNFMRIGVLINTFFDSLDKSYEINLEKSLNQNLELVNLLERNKEDAPRINYKLEDFGFVFRARIYCSITTKRKKRNSYENVVKRIDSELKKLYIEYFVEKRDSSSVKRTGKSSNVSQEVSNEDLSQYQQILLDLNSGEKKKIMNSLKIIEENKIILLKEKLEYLFNNKDEDIVNRSFDVFMSLEQ